METPTIFDYFNETFQLPDDSYVMCEFLDTGGKEKYNAMNRQYYQRANCCVLVYDITRKDTFKECENYYKQEIIKYCKKGIKVLLIGNKEDLEKDRKVAKEEAKYFSLANNYYFKETSCVSTFNVMEAFETIILETYGDLRGFRNSKLDKYLNF